MPKRWKPPKGDRTDAEAIRREKELRRKLADIIAYGTEEDFVQAVKAYKPDVGGEELKFLIMQFRDAVREKRGL
jgi:hypothetical protein